MEKNFSMYMHALDAQWKMGSSFLKKIWKKISNIINGPQQRTQKMEKWNQRTTNCLSSVRTAVSGFVYPTQFHDAILFYNDAR